MDKELVYKNIFDLINNGFFLDKYIEATNDFDYDITKDIKELEDKSARIFNSIIIGCQLFDDKERIEKFVDMFSSYLDPYYLEQCLPEFNLTLEEAMNRLNHGFAIHFTTTKIADIIQKTGKLIGSGKNAMFSEDEDKIIKYAEIEQKKNNPDSDKKLNYLFRGWGTGVSSYGSTTNGFWMYHTPESLTFLFGDISKRDKNAAMSSVADKIFSLDENDKKVVFNTMSNIYDRLVGEEQNTCCILIDRDAFKYETVYYYNTGTPIGVEQRPFNNSLDSLTSNDSSIDGDIDINNLKFLKIPTVIELEKQKQEQLTNDNSHQRL